MWQNIIVCIITSKSIFKTVNNLKKMYSKVEKFTHKSFYFNKQNC